MSVGVCSHQCCSEQQQLTESIARRVSVLHAAVMLQQQCLEPGIACGGEALWYSCTCGGPHATGSCMQPASWQVCATRGEPPHRQTKSNRVWHLWCWKIILQCSIAVLRCCQQGKDCDPQATAAQVSAGACPCRHHAGIKGPQSVAPELKIVEELACGCQASTKGAA